MSFQKVLETADLNRISANSKLNQKEKSNLGQFFTHKTICLYMASLFEKMEGHIKLLDPGMGPGSLTAAFIDEAIKRGGIDMIRVHGSEIDESILPYTLDTLQSCVDEGLKADINIDPQVSIEDFIINHSKDKETLLKDYGFTHVIMNPPYKKIATKSEHRKALREWGIETVNLYAGFVAKSILMLEGLGELVAIIPRSFCNGPYYLPFRKLILEKTAIRHIHIFESRTDAFQEDKVLQENIIIHLIKGKTQGDVTITSSPKADFSYDKTTNSITATDKTTRTVNFESIVKPNDPQFFFHIAANNHDQKVIDRLSVFTGSYEALGINISTGPVVDFRSKEDLEVDFQKGCAPLIYPIHLVDGRVDWPKKSKKPNAINVSNKTKTLLWKNQDYFILIKRFSSKEEKRRIVANIYDSSIDSELIGFDNGVNVYHNKKTGFAENLAKGLFVYLNSTLLDKYYRMFGGHTQVNATDLKTIHYPPQYILERMGTRIVDYDVDQKQIDIIMAEEIERITGDSLDPLDNQDKIDQAIQILNSLGMPKAQQNERSALTLLALLNLKPESRWEDVENPMLGVTPIMDWCRDIYGKAYAPNTRETFRRQTLHQFKDGGLCLYNPDKPERPVNSPKACYQIPQELIDILSKFGTDEWEELLSNWLKSIVTLREQYAKEREMQMIPLILDDGTEIALSPGKHSQLIHDIVTEFGPRFAPGAEVIYIGDTGAKEDFFKQDRLKELGVVVDRKGKLPDVVLYWEEKNWLLLIESVTSHGPVDGKRHGELSILFKGAKPGLVYVTAFPDREKTMREYLPLISWETEVWTSDAPTHMIHFNGDKFLGPHE